MIPRTCYTRERKRESERRNKDRQPENSGTNELVEEEMEEGLYLSRANQISIFRSADYTRANGIFQKTQRTISRDLALNGTSQGVEEDLWWPHIAELVNRRATDIDCKWLLLIWTRLFFTPFFLIRELFLGGFNSMTIWSAIKLYSTNYFCNSMLYQPLALEWRTSRIFCPKIATFSQFLNIFKYDPGKTNNKLIASQ